MTSRSCSDRFSAALFSMVNKCSVNVLSFYMHSYVTLMSFKILIRHCKGLPMQRNHKKCIPNPIRHLTLIPGKLFSDFVQWRSFAMAVHY